MSFSGAEDQQVLWVGRGKRPLFTRSMCPAVQWCAETYIEPSSYVPYVLLLCYGDVYPDVLWYRRVWRASDILWCFLACDVTHCRWPGILKLAPKEDNVRIYTDPWRSLRTDYRIQNLGLLCANAEYKGWQRGDNTAGQTWEWGAGIWTATDAWPHIGLPLPLPAQKDLIFAEKVLSPKLRGGRVRTLLPTSHIIYVSISMYTIAFTFAKN